MAWKESKLHYRLVQWLKNNGYSILARDSPKASVHHPKSKISIEGDQLYVNHHGVKPRGTLPAISVETSTLFAQVNGELYSGGDEPPTQVQSLVEETKVLKITDRFRASVVSARQG